MDSDLKKQKNIQPNSNTIRSIYEQKNSKRFP